MAIAVPVLVFEVRMGYRTPAQLNCGPACLDGRAIFSRAARSRDARGFAFV
jgi:hypothetical protein